MSEQLDVLKLIVERLDAARIEYMITGSIAAGLYGQPRMTRDIDIVAVLYPSHAARLSEQLAPEFVSDVDVIRDAIAGRRTFSVVHRRALLKIDLIVRSDDEYELEKFGRRRTIEIDGRHISVISPEDLVLSKLVWAKDSRSDLQLRDVRSIIASQSGLDRAYMHRWALRLTVSALLAELAS